MQDFHPHPFIVDHVYVQGTTMLVDLTRIKASALKAPMVLKAVRARYISFDCAFTDLDEVMEKMRSV